MDDFDTLPRNPLQELVKMGVYLRTLSRAFDDILSKDSLRKEEINQELSQQYVLLTDLIHDLDKNASMRVFHPLNNAFCDLVLFGPLSFPVVLNTSPSHSIKEGDRKLKEEEKLKNDIKILKKPKSSHMA